MSQRTLKLTWLVIVFVSKSVKSKGIRKATKKTYNWPLTGNGAYWGCGRRGWGLKGAGTTIGCCSCGCCWGLGFCCWICCVVLEDLIISGVSRTWRFFLRSYALIAATSAEHEPIDRSSESGKIKKVGTWPDASNIQTCGAGQIARRNDKIGFFGPGFNIPGQPLTSKIHFFGVSLRR